MAVALVVSCPAAAPCPPFASASPAPQLRRKGVPDSMSAAAVAAAAAVAL